MVKKSQATTKETTIAKTPDEIWANSAPREYKLLNKVNEYDHEIVEELAEAMNEIVIIEQRRASLQALVNEHTKYAKFIWKTLEQVNIPMHKITDDHMRNILTYTARADRPVSKELKAEALSRGITVPVQQFGREFYDTFSDELHEAYRNFPRGKF